MTNAVVEGNIGMYNYHDDTGTFDIYVDQSIFIGTTSWGIENDTEFTLYIGASKLDGGANTSGTYNCVHCYDEDYDALESDCQPPP